MEAHWTTACFDVWATLQRDDGSGSLSATLQMSLQSAETRPRECTETYFLASPFRMFSPLVALWPGPYRSRHTVTWGMVEGEELQDLQEIGVRVFILDKSIRSTLLDVYKTFRLYRAIMTRGPGVSKAVAEDNAAFLRSFAHDDMQPKPVLAQISVDDLQSGDFIGVVRLDGLDPMIMWGTGSRLGHTGLILRQDGKVFVCESTSSSNYWPKDGIQMTEYHDWIQLAAAADYNVIWVPLSGKVGFIMRSYPFARES
jgi:hypothetical protein